jgi:hypothetical protein
MVDQGMLQDDGFETPVESDDDDWGTKWTSKAAEGRLNPLGQTKAQAQDELDKLAEQERRKKSAEQVAESRNAEVWFKAEKERLEKSAEQDAERVEALKAELEVLEQEREDNLRERADLLKAKLMNRKEEKLKQKILYEAWEEADEWWFFYTNGWEESEPKKDAWSNLGQWNGTPSSMFAPRAPCQIARDAALGAAVPKAGSKVPKAQPRPSKAARPQPKAAVHPQPANCTSVEQVLQEMDLQLTPNPMISADISGDAEGLFHAELLELERAKKKVALDAAELKLRQAVRHKIVSAPDGSASSTPGQYTGPYDMDTNKLNYRLMFRNAAHWSLTQGNKISESNKAMCQKAVIDGATHKMHAIIYEEHLYADQEFRFGRWEDWKYASGF